jgi:hypothetical protein
MERQNRSKFTCWEAASSFPVEKTALVVASADVGQLVSPRRKPDALARDGLEFGKLDA